MLAAYFFRRFVAVGRITVISPDGTRRSYSGQPGPQITIRLHDPALTWKLLLNPKLAIGEAYMDGTLTVEDGSLHDFLKFLTINNARQPGRWSLALLLRHLHQFNPIALARANASHHYDLPDRLYGFFLDRDRQYSCADFHSPDDDLETAQLNKKRHIAAKLLLQPGQRVLDIGSGWGGLALHLAATCDVTVTGITLAEEQVRISRQRAAEAGLSGRVQFHLRDYREERGRYDRIVSIGMFEHVGIRHYREFFGRLRELLNRDGVALLHAIGRKDGPGATNPWLRKYIFPGGYSPALSEVIPVVERSGLWMTDIEILRLHYALTLAAWQRRFEAHRDEIERLYGARFYRMWDFYLNGAELSFRYDGNMVWQMQLARTIDAVPITRDYVTAAEQDQIRRGQRLKIYPHGAESGV